AVQIHLRVEAVFQWIDVRALFGAVFFYVTVADLCIDECGLADRRRDAHRNSPDDLYTAHFAGIVRTFEVSRDGTTHLSPAGFLYWLQFTGWFDLRGLGEPRTLSGSTESRRRAG